MPSVLRPGGPVRTSANIQSARSAIDVHTFWPVTRYTSPSRTARVDSEARSLPAPGSEKP